MSEPMLTRKFDAYGETLPEVIHGNGEDNRTVSAVVGRIGQYAFWALVGVIVAARIIYYPAAAADRYHFLQSGHSQLILSIF